MSSVFVSRLPVRVPASRRSRLLPWVRALSLLSFLFPISLFSGDP